MLYNAKMVKRIANFVGVWVYRAIGLVFWVFVGVVAFLVGMLSASKGSK